MKLSPFVLAAKAAYDHIGTKRNRPWKNEEEVRLAWVAGLEAAMGIHFDAERDTKDYKKYEQGLISGREKARLS